MTQQKIIVDPIKNVLAILEDKSSLKTKNSSKRQFAYYDFFLQRF
jgi:hypothetical protein